MRSGIKFNLALTLCVLAAACARMGAPTGGPEDKTPPRVESIVPAPDSTGVDRHSRVSLTFSEGVRHQEAERLIHLTPAAGRLFFDWQGRTVHLRPADSLRADITYRVSLEPGLTDLHRVKADSAFESWFSTGSRFSPGRLSGRVFYRDSLVIGALICAVSAADTGLAFDCRSDSSGRWSLPYLPFGSFRLNAYHDRNRNRRFDFSREEGLDTLAAASAEPTVLDLRLALADTTAPLLLTVSVIDSLRLGLAFDDYLDSLQTFDPASFRLCAGDSAGKRVEIQAAHLDSLDHHRVLLGPAAPLEPDARYWIKPGPLANEAGLRLSEAAPGKEFTFKKEAPAGAQTGRKPQGQQPGGRQR
ncbi:Ig-like domain-containing protein [bacterium]|nr:Ig-like domain-containing protein [bacterium]